MSKGIDYGNGLTNINLQTQIRYGVINANEVGQAWYDSSEAQCRVPGCGHCGNKYSKRQLSLDSLTMLKCKWCGKKGTVEEATQESEPFEHTYTEDGYKCSQSHDDCDIFVIESPYYTFGPLCSPCAPGACSLLEGYSEETGEKTYCFGHDWFEEGKAPYNVFSVESGLLVTTSFGDMMSAILEGI